MSKTIHDLFAHTVSTYGNAPALASKRGGSWRTTSWQEYGERTRRTARGFIKLGLEPGAGVSIVGYNCEAWFSANLGAILAGGIPAGIYTTNSAEQCRYIAEHSDSAIAVVEDAAQLAKFKEVRAQLPKLEALVLMKGEDDDPDVYSWDELLALGDELPDADLQARTDAQKPEDVCTLIYTSGTTGEPKAVMLTHDNIIKTGNALISAFRLERHHVISYLPLSHIAEQITALHGPLVTGGCTWFAQSMDTLGDDLRDARPHMFVAVPRVWEKIQEKMTAAGKDAPWLRKQIVAQARRIGLAAGYADQEGRARPALYNLADKMVFSKVRARLGLDRCRFAFTAAAPIARHTLEFFLGLGVPIYEIYGMSECTGPATISTPTRYRTGKAGYVLPGTELKIAEDGEICMRGFHVFSGYLKNQEATDSALDDEGWLHSGDIGTIDENGFLQITDRKKDLLITAGGENIAPQVLEGHLKSIPMVSQAVVVGDRRKYLAALLTLDPEKIEDEARAANSPARSVAEAATCAVFEKHLQRQIDEVNSKLARVQTIKRWVVIPEEFTVDGGELTPTMKLRRKIINDKHAGIIEGLYQ